MMIEITRPRRPFSAAVLAVLLAGCGGSPPPEADASASTPASTSAADPARAAAGAGAGCPAEAGEVAMRTSASGPEYRFRVIPAPAGGDRAVDSIAVRRGCDVVQTLAVGENFALPDDAPRLSLVDVDFDGHGDLAFLAFRGMSDTESEYWRYDPAAGRFQPLGTFPTFAVDSARRELATHTRGGHAGLIFRSARHRHEDGRIVPVREEAQDWSDEAERYVRTVHERRGARMVETARDTLTREQAERAASEQE